MRRSHGPAAGSRRWAILLLTVVLPPAVTLVWLGVQLLQQDRVVLSQRERDRQTAVGEAVAAELRKSLTNIERFFDDDGLPEGVARFSFSSEGMEITPAARLLWTPVPRRLRPAEQTLFAETDSRESRRDLAGALRFYSRFSRSADPAVRAGALRRLARVQQIERRWDAALDTYRALSEVRGVSDLDMPVDLLARRSAADVLQVLNRTAELSATVTQIEVDLLASKWSLDSGAWAQTVDDIGRWRGVWVDVPADRRSFSALADRIWLEFRDGAAAISSGWRLIDVDGTSVTIGARPSSAGLIVVAVSQPVLEAWSQSAVAGTFADESRLALTDTAGRLVAGQIPPMDAPVIRLNVSDTDLPWALTLHSPLWSTAGKEFEHRRRLLSVGLATILLLLAGGSYFLWRVVQRDVAVSRLQTEFVAAVSHEFRTPLASLRHATELLEEDDDMSSTRRRSFYELYRRNTERLQQLVESLLDFARMEAGRKAYDLRPIEAAEFATQVLAEFQRHVGADTRIALDVSAAGGLQLHGDRDALANALWNLLDNAVKYSPEGRPIDVRVGPHPSGVAIAVLDRGLGIPRHERDAIFQRFVRGKRAVGLGIRGTGLGLAMVAHIVRAHGGDVEVESEVERGSTFRLVLPASPGAPTGVGRYKTA